MCCVDEGGGNEWRRADVLRGLLQTQFRSVPAPLSSVYSYTKENNEIAFSHRMLASAAKASSEEKPDLEGRVSRKNFWIGCAAAACLTIFSPLSPLRAAGLEPGYWKIISTPVVNGATAPPQTKMLCLSPDEAIDLEKLFAPRMATVNSDCERSENELTPTSLKWRLTCTGQMTMDVAGVFMFDTPQHYSAEVTTKGSIAGQSMETRVTIDAERVGECPRDIGR
jgi:hypothetical protein